MSRDLRLGLLFAVVAAVFRLPFLAFPTEEYFDEVYHAKSAHQYLAGETPVEWLLARGLVVSAGWEHATMPREVAIALRGGRIFPDN